MIEPSLIIDNLTKVSFKEAKIVSGDDKSPFYLDVTYIFENLYGIYELHIPRINMSGYFLSDQIPCIMHDHEDPFDYPGMGRRRDNLLKPRNSSPNFLFSEINCGALVMEDDPNLEMHGRGFEVKTIKEKEQEMTLEQIEKKLGHKVKIVAK